jgi:hypothetical protein
MKRLLALALAAIMAGPTCLCAATTTAEKPAAEHACCQSADTGSEDSSAPAPAQDCCCSSCHIKRSLASASIELPPLTWTSLEPFLADWHYLDAVIPSAGHGDRLLTGAGPPHDTRALLVRYHALLL